MAKISGLNSKERALAERIGGSKIRKGQGMSDTLALGVGFVIARRSDPTVPLQTYLKRHTAEQVRESLEDYPRRTSGDGDQ